jgi:protein-tyrosine phosphatase
MAEVVLSSMLADAGLEDRVEVVSAGTGDWHVGRPMDRRAAATLTAQGYDASRHRAQQVDPHHLERYDAVLAMDTSNHADLTALGAGEEPGRLLMFRDFDPRADDADRDVPDPYYGEDDGFEVVLGLVRRTSAELTRLLGEVVSPARPAPDLSRDSGPGGTLGS